MSAYDASQQDSVSKFTADIQEKLAQLKSHEHQHALLQHLAKIPGASETLSIDILTSAYTTILDDNSMAEIKKLQPGEAWYHKKTNDNMHDRSFHIIRDESGEFQVFLFVKSKRFDNSKFSEAANNKVNFLHGNDNKMKPVFKINGTDGISLFAQLLSRNVYTAEQISEEKKQTQQIQQQLREIPELANTLDTEVQKESGFIKVRYAKFFTNTLATIVTNPFDDDPNAITITKAIDISQSKLQCFKDIVDQVAKMHQQNIVHRDLKPENIFFEESNGHLKPRIGDLDAAALISNANAEQQYGFVGTPQYLSPEIIKVVLPNTDKQDLIDRAYTLLMQSYGTYLDNCTEIITDLFSQTTPTAQQDKEPEDNTTRRDKPQAAELFNITGKDDVFALGIMLYEFLTNKRAPNGILDKDPTNKELPTISAFFINLITEVPLLGHMLAADANQRWDINQVQQELSTLLLSAHPRDVTVVKSATAYNEAPTYIAPMLKTLTQNSRHFSEQEAKKIRHYVESMQQYVSSGDTSPNTQKVQQQIAQLSFKVNCLLWEARKMLSQTHSLHAAQDVAAHKRIKQLELEIIQLDQAIKNAAHSNLGFIKKFTRPDHAPKG